MAEVGLDSSAGNGGTADAINPNRRQRRAVRRIAMAAAEAARIAEETNAAAAAVVLDQETVHEHKSYQEAVRVVDDAEAAAAVKAAAVVLGQDAVCVAEEENAAVRSNTKLDLCKSLKFSNRSGACIVLKRVIFRSDSVGSGGRQNQSLRSVRRNARYRWRGKGR